MGNPKHFSLELPGRCLALLDGLWPHATQIYGGERPDLGSLTSTFLIAMSIAMINAPIERIEKQFNKREGDIIIDDRQLNPSAARAFKTVIGRGRLTAAPFYEDGAWRAYRITERPFPNLANGLPEDVADHLASDEALDAARRMQAEEWISILRNGLAHSGIAYLDEDGRSTYDRPVKMYAFVSAKPRDPDRISILRISEDDYRRFLTKWVEWLEATKLAQRAAA